VLSTLTNGRDRALTAEAVFIAVVLSKISLLRVSLLLLEHWPVQIDVKSGIPVNRKLTFEGWKGRKFLRWLRLGSGAYWCTFIWG